MVRPKVLILGLYPLQYNLFNALAAREYRLFGTFYKDSYYKGISYEKVHLCDRRDLRSIVRFAKEVEPDAVISDQCDASHFAQAYLTEKLNLPGPRLATAHLSSNKFLQRQKAKETGVLIPVFHAIRTVEEAREAAENIGWPVMVKATDNQGSSGVHKVETLDDLPAAFYDAIAQSHERLVLVEEFIHGQEITIDGYVWPDSGPQSLTLATKSHMPDRPVAMEIHYPGILPEDLYERAMRTNEDVIRKLGFRFGMTHTEYMITKKGEIYLVESANRGGGALTSQLIVPAVSGIDLLARYIADCTGEKGIDRSEPQRNQVLLKFFALQPGIIRAIDGVDAIRKDPAVLYFDIAMKPGDTVKPIEVDSNRHVIMILKAEGDIRGKAEELFRQLHITYDSSSSPA